jgi:hypothetical protein
MNLMFNSNCVKVVKMSGVTWGILRGPDPSIHIEEVLSEIYH